jgi:CPA1 family monovalent cation:H+ antiporter
MLAVPALFISSSLIGLGIWYFLSVDMLIAFLFGALISATDPVAVISIFQELGTPKRLTTLVEGESLLNDATAIVMFSILLGLVVANGAAEISISASVLKFVGVFLGGIVVGVIMGLVVSSLLSRLTLSSSAIITLSMAMAYATFIIAEHVLHLSGVMAVVAAAVVFGVLGTPKLTQQHNHILLETWEYMVFIANTLLFILIGFSVDLASLIANFYGIIIAIILVLSSRALAVYSVVPITVKALKLPKVNLGEQTIMFWGGLKGGLAVAIVLAIPDSVAAKPLLINLTLGVVVFTLLVNAPSIEPLLNKLGMSALNQHEKAELNYGLALVNRQSKQMLNDFVENKLISQQGLEQAAHKVETSFSSDAYPGSSPHDEMRLTRLNLLQVENEKLYELYHQGLITQYTLLDLQGELNRKKEHLLNDIPSTSHLIDKRKANLFLRLEDSILQLFREHDFAAKMLSKYQNKRIYQHLTKDISSLFMSTQALKHLEKNYPNIANKSDIEQSYQQRVAASYNRIKETQRNYPSFYSQFEINIAQHTSLKSALYKLESSLHHKIIGGKAYNQIKQRLEDELAGIHLDFKLVDENNIIDYLRNTALFEGIPPNLLQKTGQQAQTITFLADDTVIKENAIGDALYIIINGELGVYKQTEQGEQQLAVLETGNQFGEIGLLHGSKRTATVRAIKESTLLRLSKPVVIELANQHKTLYERLENAHKT